MKIFQNKFRYKIQKKIIFNSCKNKNYNKSQFKIRLIFVKLISKQEKPVDAVK